MKVIREGAETIARTDSRSCVRLVRRRTKNAFVWTRIRKLGNTRVLRDRNIPDFEDLADKYDGEIEEKGEQGL